MSARDKGAEAEAEADWDREFWLKRRQALLIELAAIEERLGLTRSIMSKRQRESRRCEADQGESPQIIS
jgi:hypothetical protein